MNKAKTNYLLCLLAFLIIITGLGMRFLKKTNTVHFNDYEKETMPQWGSYRNLVKEASLFWSDLNWKVKAPGSGNSLSLKETEELKFFSAQREKQVFEKELAERQALLEEALMLRQKQLALEFTGRVKQKQNQIQSLIKAEIEKKKMKKAMELADFRRKDEEDYSLKLVSLRFKAKIPDLSPEEKLLLTKEISMLEQELEMRMEKKKQELEKELLIFEKARMQAATKEMETYRYRMKEEEKNRYFQEKQKLEEEFFEWKQKKEFDSSGRAG